MSPIAFRDPIALHPVITPGSCVYQSHAYRIVNGGTWTSATLTSSTQDTTVSYPYPSPMGVGSQQVYMDVTTSCGTISVGPKTLQINSTGTNQPPHVVIDWYLAGATSPTSSVPQNTNMDLRITSYSDPDGDPVILQGWDFTQSTPWVSGLPGKYGLDTQYGVSFSNLLADTPGAHTVYLSVGDGQGGAYTASATLNVIDPKPVACISAPSSVKVNRTVTPAISSCSTSPAGDAIVQEVWTNRAASYPVSGIQTVKLSVQDSAGRWSDEVTKDLQVIGDQPPAALLSVPSQDTRGHPITLDGSSSYSPDFDSLTRYRFEYQTDAMNNGFTDDAWQLLADGAATSAAFTPNVIGKSNFRLTVWEDYGQSGSTDVIMDTVNLAPTVTVQTSGQTNQPKTITPYSMSTLFQTWNLSTTSGSGSNRNNWFLDGSGALAAKTFKAFTDFRPGGSLMLSDGTGAPNQQLFASVQGSSMNESSTPAAYTFKDSDMVYNIARFSSPLTVAAFSTGGLSQAAWSKTFFDRQWYTGGYASNNTTLFVVAKGISDGGMHLLAIQKSDGSLRYDILVQGWADYTSVLYPFATGDVLLLTQNKVYKFDASGNKLWSVNDYDNYGGTGNARFFPTASLPDSNFFYVLPGNSADSGLNGHIRGYNAADFTMKWDTYLGQNPGILGTDKAGNAIGLEKVPSGWAYGQMNIKLVSPNGQILKSSRIQADTLVPGYDDYTMYNSFAFLLGPIGADSIGNVYMQRCNYNNSPATDCYVHIFNADGALVKTFSTGTTGYNQVVTGSDGLVTLIGGTTTSKIAVMVLDPGNQFSIVTQKITGLPTGAAGAYIGDQQLLFANGARLDASSNPLTHSKAFEVGTPFSDIWIGGASIYNETVRLTLMPTKASNEGIGVALRVWNSTNYLSVEFRDGYLQLNRVVGGVVTTLAEVPYSIANRNTYGLKVVPNGSNFDVYVNEIYQFSGTDSSFGSGQLGIVNRGQQGAVYTSLSYESGGGLTGAIQGVALVNGTLTYAIGYSDPEGDPRLTQNESWVIQHNPNVFMNPQGTWSGSGGTYPSAPVAFSLPGEYTFTFRSRDDPHPGHLYPDLSFDSYRQWSNALNGSIRVHRAPIASFAVSLNADNSLGYTDLSYDPDRYDPSTGASSTEATGINYAANHGILEWKWRYKNASDTSYRDGKLLYPPSAGTWDIELAVKDEYGAWSEWYGQSVTTAAASSHVNGAPGVSLTYPYGSQTNPNILSSLRPTLAWMESDPDAGTVFASAELLIRDEAGNVFKDVTAPIGTPATSAEWTLDSDLVMGTKYQVQVRVSDGQAWSAWSGIGWMATNRPPAAWLSFPWGAQASPTVVTTAMPTITWAQNDPDASTTFRMFQVQVIDGAGAIVDDSGWQWQGTTATNGAWTVGGAGLPAGVALAVQVRVTDSFDMASAWSPAAWLYVDRAPSAIVASPSGTQAAPTVVASTQPAIAWTQTDPDAGASFGAYEVRVLDAGGALVGGSGVTGQGTTATAAGWTVGGAGLPAGQPLAVQVRVADQYGLWSAWSAARWLYVNRPPAGTLTVSPARLYVSDDAVVTMTVSDPDGDALSVQLEVSQGGGAYMPVYSVGGAASGSAVTTTLHDLAQGGCTLRLTVTDARGVATVVTLPVFVSDLTMAGAVAHTPEWDAIRQRYNAAHPGGERGAGTFWAGERFMLAATVTDTGTATIPTQVSATLVETGDTVTLTGAADRVDWTGELWTDQFQKLADGPYTVRFTTVWSNGYTSADDVPVNLSGSIYAMLVPQLRN